MKISRKLKLNSQNSQRSCGTVNPLPLTIPSLNHHRRRPPPVLSGFRSCQNLVAKRRGADPRQGCFPKRVPHPSKNPNSSFRLMNVCFGNKSSMESAQSPHIYVSLVEDCGGFSPKTTTTTTEFWFVPLSLSSLLHFASSWRLSQGHKHTRSPDRPFSCFRNTRSSDNLFIIFPFFLSLTRARCSAASSEAFLFVCCFLVKKGK